MSSGGRLGRWLACSQRSPRVLECLYGRPARRARCLPSSSSPSSRPSSYAASAFPPSGHPSPAEMSSTCTKLASRLSRLVSPSAPSPRGSAPTSGCALLIGTPFRESGPPACMAKLIMLRHKVSPPARAARLRRRDSSWVVRCRYSRTTPNGETTRAKPDESHVHSTHHPPAHRVTSHGCALGGHTGSKIIDCIPPPHPYYSSRALLGSHLYTRRI